MKNNNISFAEALGYALKERSVVPSYVTSLICACFVFVTYLHYGLDVAFLVSASYIVVMMLVYCCFALYIKFKRQINDS